MNDGVAHAGSRGTGDVAPGQLYGTRQSFAGGLGIYLVGLALAGGLTIASFWAADTDLIYGPAVKAALVTLAIAQMGVHLVFFLHITTAPDNANNVLALAFGILIVFLVVAGSLWIMANLNHMSVPMHELMRMRP